MVEASCSICGNAPLTQCSRCHASLCAVHTPHGGRFCDHCEEEYTALRSSLTLWPWFLVPFLIPFTYLIYHFRPLWEGTMLRQGGKQFTGHPFSDVLVVTVFAGLLLGGLVLGLRMVLFKFRFRHG